MKNSYPVQFLRTAIILLLVSSKAIAIDADSIGNADDKLQTHRINIHFQATYIYQYKPAFSANYSGPNSLKKIEERANSITSTLYLGARLWHGAELYVNPEVAGGEGLSGAYGLAASTNGETFRVGDPDPTLYPARYYLTQTVAIGTKRSSVPEGPNETGGNKPADYIRFYLGKMSLGDIFDNNACANSPRTQFMNWCLMNNGAWDYAANLRGYTYTFATVLQNGSMSYKAALATLPTVANGADLNTDLGQEYSINAEVDKSFTCGPKKRKGNARLLFYYNNGDMGSYAEALRNPPFVWGPDVTAYRKYGRTKTGAGISVDHEISDNTSGFFRLGWNDGKNETWCFTEADQSASVGLSIKGSSWKRSDDILALAILGNGLSKDHRNYLAAGGLGFQLGDNALNYRHESAFETYYSYKVKDLGLWLSLDYQFILNPGYNADRGPVNVFSFRVHTEL